MAMGTERMSRKHSLISIEKIPFSSLLSLVQRDRSRGALWGSQEGEHYCRESPR